MPGAAASPYLWSGCWCFFEEGDPARAFSCTHRSAAGARWGLAGAEAILTLRALISNGDFDQYGSPVDLGVNHRCGRVIWMPEQVR